MSVLLSGFVAFGELRSNPTERLVDTLESEAVNTILLPVSYERAFTELEQAIHILSPDTLIMTGVASKRKCISLERIGINIIDAEIPDNDGMGINGTNIDASGADGIFSNIDLQKIYHKYDHKNLLPLEISNTAGSYVCNYLYYKALNQFKNSMDIIFIHVPLTSDDDPNSTIKFQELEMSMRLLVSLMC